MKRQPCSWHIAIHGVCLVLVLIRYVNAQSQCNCLSSPGASKNCQSCDAGCYLLDNRCYKCPDNCMNCSSTSYCGQCLTGFYGTTCKYSCSICMNGQCSKTGCIKGCVDGYYQTQGGPVCKKCRSECDTCNSYWNCTTCKPGYYGTYCQYTCSICKDNTCYKNNGYCINGCRDYHYPSINVACCPSTCTSCDSYYNCTNCTTGYYGSDCQKTCINCKHNACDKVNVQCSQGCADGYYKTQEQNCVRCPKYCVRCRSDTDCTACDSGYYGPSCGSKCDPKCRYDACNANTGKCTNGCVDGYYQNGSSCLLNCPIHFCQTCTSDNQFCSVCNDGYYPFNGNCAKCSGACVNGKCDKEDGRCSEGCINGFTTLYCNDQCYPNCISCEQYNKETCTSCKAGYYGPKCENKCNAQCKEVEGVLSCAKTNGECTQGCENGYTGSTCAEKCSVNCVSCAKNGERSCDRCIPGFYGPLCEHTCYSTCYNPNNGSSVCDKQTGRCLRSCTPTMCESIAQDQSVGTARPIITPVIIAAITGFVACLVLCVTGIVVFVLVRRKRRNTSNAEQTNETLENNADTVYSVLDHAYQGRTTDYTALHTLRGQPQQVQVISSPHIDGDNATYVNADGTTAEPEKDGYENVFL